MLLGEHSAILSMFSKLPVIIMTFVLSIFEWLFYTGFTVISKTFVKLPLSKRPHSGFQDQLSLITYVKRPHSKRPKIGFQDQLLLNASQKCCRMHSAISSTFIKLPVVIKTFVLSIFEWPFYCILM